MGTTRVKVVDLSNENEVVKKKPKQNKQPQKIEVEKPVTSDNTEKSVITDNESVEEPTVSLEEEATKIAEEDAKSTSETEKAATKESVKTVVAKKSKPKKQKHHLGKNYKSAKAEIEDRLYTPAEALDLIAKTSFTKFDPTVEIHLNVTDKNIRGSVAFPHSVGEKKQKKVLFFSDKKIEDKKIISGDEKTIDEIEKGTLKPGRDFDIVYSSPKFMPLLAKVAKVLGPRGLMPNPKTGTIIDDAKSIAAEESANSYDYRCDPKAPVIHAKIGKLSAKSQNLNENLKALILAIGPSKIIRATLASTMGPGIHLDVSKN